MYLMNLKGREINHMENSNSLIRNQTKTIMSSKFHILLLRFVYLIVVYLKEFARYVQ